MNKRRRTKKQMENILYVSMLEKENEKSNKYQETIKEWRKKKGLKL